MKTRISSATVVALVAAAACVSLLLSSCGGGGDRTPLAASDKVADRPGLLGGESKPVALTSEPAAVVAPAGLAGQRPVGVPPGAGTVPQERSNWYETNLVRGNQYIVTLQPSEADEDSDLYVLRPGRAGMQLIGNSRRGHDGNTLATPDWVAFTSRDAGRHPIGVYGFSPTIATDPSDFRLEVDAVAACPTTATPATVALRDSAWFSLSAAAGTQYTITVVPSAGDPDLFVYGGASDRLRGSSTNAAGNDSVTFTASATESHYVRVYGVSAATFTIQLTQAAVAQNRLFFLHHSTGAGLIGGGMRERVATYNAAHATHFEFWDHGYNGDALTDGDGNATGICYNIPDDNTDPVGLHYLWTSSNADGVASRNLILGNYRVIAFKSCFPASAIPDAATLAQYKTWYLQMRNFFDTRTDRLFVVVSTPPLHRLATNTTEAANARAFAEWLKSGRYLSGHPNVVCYDLFNALARANDGTATANRLKYEYEGSHSDSDSHPNATANATVGPLFAQFLCEQAASH